MSNPQSSISPTNAPHVYQQQVFVAGSKGQKPTVTFDTTKWEKLTKETLAANSWGYLSGNAGIGETCTKNCNAFRTWSILPNRLVQSQYPSLETTVLGQKLAYPIAVAPIGVQRIFHPDGERAVATASATLNIPYILSSATCTSFEDVALANGFGTRLFQFYWPANKDNRFTISLLSRAKAAGYTALFVTVDTFAMGWRPADMDHEYDPFIVADNVGVELGFSDPILQSFFKEKYGKDIRDDMGTAAVEWAGIHTPGFSHTWEDLSFLRQHWDGPIVLKGIQTVKDARMAVEMGMQGIVVSNHGGRQQDGLAATLDTLPAIVEAVGNQLDVLFDSGVRSGVDVVKALALGAKCVLIGRPFIYGLAINGQSGVKHVLEAILGEMEMTLHQAGIHSVQPKHLNRDCLVKDTFLDTKPNSVWGESCMMERFVCVNWSWRIE